MTTDHESAAEGRASVRMECIKDAFVNWWQLNCRYGMSQREALESFQGQVRLAIARAEGRGE